MTKLVDFTGALVSTDLLCSCIDFMNRAFVLKLGNRMGGLL